MQTNILWSGIEYESLENCLISTNDTGNEITSTIIGTYQNKIYKVEYLIKTNQNWLTTFFEIKSRHTDQTQVISFESDTNGNWSKAGQPLKEFEGCLYIDIPLTPFTNTLPINHLKLRINQEELIKVIYLDLLENEIKVVNQKYICLSENEYKYENIPNDFEAVIKVDENGFVINYPFLFERKASLITNYFKS